MIVNWNWRFMFGEKLTVVSEGVDKTGGFKARSVLLS